MTLRTKAAVVIISMLLCLTVPHSHVLLAQSNSTDQGLEKIRAELRDTSWEKRREGFYMLLGFESPQKWDGRTYLIPGELTALFRAHPERTNDLQLALIRLLDTENSEIDSQKKSSEPTGKALDEEYTDYYGDVIGAVAGLKDPRALDALMGAMGTGGMAADGLAALGTPALDALIKASEDPNPVTRLAACRALTGMWRPKNREKFSDDTTSPRLEKAFLRAAEDRDESVRDVGAVGLGLIPKPDEATIQALIVLAIYDPTVLPEQADDGGPLYPVRRAASKSLAQIGPPALDPLIDRFGLQDTRIRVAVVRALATMWEPNNRRAFSDAVYRDRFSVIFLRAAADREVSVRSASVRGLALVASAETIQALRSLATSDPAIALDPGNHSSSVYPVRQSASRALDQITH